MVTWCICAQSLRMLAAPDDPESPRLLIQMFDFGMASLSRQARRFMASEGVTSIKNTYKHYIVLIMIFMYLFLAFLLKHFAGEQAADW